MSNLKGFDCVLHIGMPKCGSSALQAALSSQPKSIHDDKGRKLVYIAIDPKGKVLFGDHLRFQASTSKTGYLLSAQAHKINTFSDKQFKGIKLQLRKLWDEKTLFVLSNEAWGNQYHIFEEKKLLEKLGLSVHVVMYVRPQVAWFNSAWWQWGAWSDVQFNRWLSLNKSKADWFLVYSEWSKLSHVKGVTVRLLPDDIVSDFYGLFGIKNDMEFKQNTSLSAGVLKLFQRHRELRENAHDSEIDFILGRHLGDMSRPPWVLPLDLVNELVGYFMANNKKLLAILDSEQKEMMKKNKAWWSADFYKNKQLTAVNDKSISLDEIEDIAVSAIKSLVILDQQYRLLERKVEKRNHLNCLAVLLEKFGNLFNFLKFKKNFALRRK